MQRLKIALAFVGMLTLMGCGSGGGGSDSLSETVEGVSDNDVSPSNNNPSANRAPVADAGDLIQLNYGEVIRLDGSRSYDSDGDELYYKWTVLSSPDNLMPLTDFTNTPSPIAVRTRDGEYVFQLVVTDDIDESEPSTVTVQVSNTDEWAPIRPPESVEYRALYESIEDHILGELAAPDTFKVDGDIKESHYSSLGKPEDGAISFYFTADSNSGVSTRLKAVCPITWFSLAGYWINDFQKTLNYCFYYSA